MKATFSTRSADLSIGTANQVLFAFTGGKLVLRKLIIRNTKIGNYQGLFRGFLNYYSLVSGGTQRSITSFNPDYTTPSELQAIQLPSSTIFLDTIQEVSLWIPSKEPFISEWRDELFEQKIEVPSEYWIGLQVGTIGYVTGAFVDIEYIFEKYL